MRVSGGGGGTSGGSVKTGLWADRDTAFAVPTTGDRYIASDSELEQIYSGGAWLNYWPGHGFVSVAALAGYTSVSVTGTIVSEFGGYTLKCAANQGVTITKGITQGRKTILGFHAPGFRAYSYSLMLCFGMFNVAAGKGTRFSFAGNGSGADGRVRFVMENGLVNNAYTGNLTDYGVEEIPMYPHFIMIDDSDGTNVKFSVADHRKGPWTQWYSITRAAGTNGWAAGGDKVNIEHASYTGAEVPSCLRLLCFEQEA